MRVPISPHCHQHWLLSVFFIIVILVVIGYYLLSGHQPYSHLPHTHLSWAFRVIIRDFQMFKIATPLVDCVLWERIRRYLQKDSSIGYPGELPEGSVTLSS